MQDELSPYQFNTDPVSQPVDLNAEQPLQQFAEGGEVMQEPEEPDSEGYYQQLLAQYAGYGAPPQTPVQSFAEGGSVSLDAMNALIAASEPQTEDEAAADYLSQSQRMLADLGPRTSPRQATGMRRVLAPSGGGAASPKEMELAAGPLATGQDFAIKEPKAKSKGKGGKSAKEQLQALALQYKLKLRAAENESRGLMRSTLGAPTLEQPTLTSETLGVRRFQKGGEAKKADEDFLKDIRSRAEEGTDYRAMLEYLQSRDAVPDIRTEYLPDDASAVFSTIKLPTGRGAIKINKDLVGSNRGARIGPSTLAHEMAHAADRQMQQQAGEQTGLFSKGNQFTDAYERLVGPGGMRDGQRRADLARKYHRGWVEQNKDYRAAPYEIAAHGVGNYAGPTTASKGPLHVDATAATEFQILLDLARRNSKGAVKRAEGSPKEGEVSDAELEAASRPAFVTPKSGKGRKRGPISDALNTGSAYVAAAKGASELPYDIAGAPVDIATMALRPLGYNVDKPVMGSDWIKQQMTRAGVRQAPPEDPTAKGFYTAGELMANVVNPAAVVRSGVRGAQRVGQAARSAAQDFQQYNRQLAVPGASYAAPPRREAESLYTPRPTTDAPFVGRIDQFAASLPGPVRKDQLLGQLKGKFRDYEIGRAQEALADLDVTAKITPSDLLNRLKQSSDPARYRTQVVEPDSTSFYRTMDNPYQDRPMGVIHLIQDQLPEVAAQSGRLKTLFDNVRSKTYGTLGQSEEEVNNLSRSIQELTKSTPPNLVSQITTAFTPYVQAQKARRDFADLEDTLLYPTLSSRYKGLVRERMNDPEQQALGSLQITRKAAEDTITEAAEKLATQYNVPQIRQYVPGLVEGNKEAQKQVEDITEALRGDLRSQIQREGQSLRAALDRTISAGVKPYRGQHSGLKNDPDPIAFSRFSEHETVIPGIGPTKGIYIHELQSDRLDDIRKLGPLGGNVSTDFHEKYLPLMGKKDALMKEFVQLRSTGQSGDRYNEVLKQIGKVDSDIAKINKRIQEGTYSLKESFPGMENSPQVIQQLMAKNAIAAAINRGVNFVAFPGAESAQAQLYEKLPRNLKEVVKDLGPGFEYSSVTLRKPDGTEIMHPAVIWGTESAARVKKEGVPFKKGGLVDKNTAFIKAHA
jgi:hypothetical protein